MKKLGIILSFLFLSLSGLCQDVEWKPLKPVGLVYSDSSMTIISTPKNFMVSGIWVADVILCDSLGHQIRCFERLGLNTREEEIAYKIIYKHITEVNGWVIVNKKDIPTLRRYDWD